MKRESSGITASIIERLEQRETALTSEELSDFLNISRFTLSRWTKAKRIPHFRIGRSVRFCAATIAQWLKSRQRMPQWFEQELATR